MVGGGSNLFFCKKKNSAQKAMASSLGITNLGISNLFGSRKQSQTQILCKKIDIVTSPHIEEPQWDIVMDITDALNNDSGRAKRVLSHLKRILEKSFISSLDNQQLSNCLVVIDSFTRNGNDNILSVIHSTFLSTLSKLAKKAEEDTKKVSLIQSKKNCRDHVLELILDWQQDIDSNKYPNFRTIYIELKQDGLPFDKIITERERIKKQKKIDEINRKLQIEQNKKINEEKKEDINNNNDNDTSSDDEDKYNNPWSNRNIPFGKWYKSKLINDLNQLIDMICMAQDIISMKNINDSLLICMELRESNKRLISIMLRTKDPAACDCFMQLIIIISSLLDCCKKLKNGQKFIIPGVSRQFLHLIIKCL